MSSERKKQKNSKPSGLWSQFRMYRNAGLGFVEAWFNAFYVFFDERASATNRLSSGKKEPFQGENGNSLLSKFASVLLFLFSWEGKHPSSKDRAADDYAARRKAGKTKLFLKKYAGSFLIFALLIVIVFYIGNSMDTSLVLYAKINDTVVGIVEDHETVDRAIREVEKNVESVLGEKFSYPYEVTYSVHREKGDNFTPKKEIVDQLYSYIRSYICTASGLYVDGVLVAICQDEQTVQLGFEEFVRRNTNGEDNGFFNEIEIVTQAYPSKSVISAHRLSLLLEEMSLPFDQRDKGTIPEQKPSDPPPSVQFPSEPGDGVLIPDTVVFPEKGTVSVYPQPIDGVKLNFYHAIETNYEKTIPHETIYHEDSTLFTSMEENIKPGKDGVAGICALVYYVDGKEVRRDILSETVLQAPVSRQVTVGIKVLPEDMGVTSFYGSPGRFIVPRVGWVSSYYGAREDGFHNGWDIPSKKGQSIYAAASGVVITVIGPDYAYADRNLSYFVSYGYCVMLRHEDGFSTLYGHCSQVNVTIGQYVKQGQKIAEIGSTGNSTGPHVHFEVRKNDIRVNPANYLYFGNKTIYN